jgi:cytochrome P450
VQMKIVAILAEFVKERQANPQEDMMSDIIRSDIDGRELSFEELLSIAHLLFLAGLDTVVNALSFGMKHLAGDAALQQRIIDDPGCIANVTEELLRRYSFINLPRYIETGRDDHLPTGDDRLGREIKRRSHGCFR